MKTQFLIATTSIAAAMTVAAPAGARTVAPPMVPIAAQSSTPSPTQRVCVVDTITGSHIPTKLCHTRAEWAKLGIDPFAK